MPATVRGIRNARIGEVETLGRIEDRASMLFEDTEIAKYLNGEIYDPSELEKLIEQGRVFVACFEDDVAVGFVILTELGGNAHIDELDVLPAFGHRGIGKALLEYACGWARDSGFSAVTLSTFRDIPWNAPFYSRYGFRVLEAAELTLEMLRLRSDESSRGLPLEKRVIMLRELS
jgi:GNAT superfamily N-acetyltransferase